MRWIQLITVCLSAYCVLSQEDDDSNSVSPPLSKVNLDSNLRRALLKALTELENEEKEKNEYNNSNENSVEKASAASVSIFANGETVTATPSSNDDNAATNTTSEAYKVVLQKSQAIRHETITTVEKNEEDAESILTSASSNFPNQQFGKVSQTEKNEKILNKNSIIDIEKSSTKLNKIEVTSLAPTVSTEENEAKAEEVQFFSAPLVAAFTVHQDELGSPKKVEPIFRSTILNKSPDEVRIENEQQIKLYKQQQQQTKLSQLQEKQKLEDFGRQREKLESRQKQKALEDEIYRLNFSLKQQQEFFLRQQEDFRVRNNAQSFSKPAVLNLVQQPPHLSSPTQGFKPQSIILQPSLSFDPLVEAGKLPLNGQFLPIKGPSDFRAPFNNFNQAPNQFNNFNQQIPQNNNRFFRQNTGFGIQDFNRNTNSFSISPSLQQNFDNPIQSNRFFRSNLESALTTQFLQPSQPSQLQSNRFFRSNFESNFNNVINNDQLKSLLYNSGAFRGKSPEDLSLISKVLSLDHFNGRHHGISLRPELQTPFVRHF